MYSTRVEEKINPNKGSGIVFQTRKGEAITLSRTGRDLRVGVRVTSFEGNPFASHYYGSLYYPDLTCKMIDSEELFNTSNQPEESRVHLIKVSRITNKPIISRTDIGFGVEARTEVGLGQHTVRFNSIHELIEAIESEFNRLFGEPWVLYDYNTDRPWDEYKVELLNFYA